MSNAERLRKARKVRLLRARHFNLLRNEQVTISEILESTPDVLKKMRIYDVLRRSHKLGNKGAEAILKRAHVWPLRTVGQLSEEEKKAILRELPLRARKSPQAGASSSSELLD